MIVLMLRGVFNGPINGEALKAYVEKELLKTLKRGDVVVLDNLQSHKGKAVRKLIESPERAYSSCRYKARTSIPIEQVFAKNQAPDAKGHGTDR